MFKSIFKTNKKLKFFAIFCACFIAFLGVALFARAGTLSDAAIATGEDILTLIIGYPLNLIAGLLGYAVRLAGGILDWTLSNPAFALIKDNAVINVGWKVVRDLVNMFFILILLIVAFAKVLGISKYQDDKIIIRLIIAAFLINFSKVICGIMIDAANVLTMFFVKGVPGSIGENLSNSLKIQNLFASGFVAGASGNAPTISKMSILITLFFVDIILAIAAMTFFYLAIILVIRMVYLWILVMLSPLAWFGWILSGNFNYASWWKQFWENLAKAPIAAFGIYMTLQIANIPGLATKINASELNGVPTWNAFSKSLNMILQYVIIIALLYMTYKGTKAGAGKTGSTAVAWGKKGAGKVYGGIKNVGKGIAGMTAAKVAETSMGKAEIQAMQARREKLEKLPGVGRMIGGPGAYREKQAAKYEKVKKSIGNKTADELLTIIDQTPIGEEGLQRRAAAIAQLAEKDSDKLTPEHQDIVRKIQGFEIGADLSKSILATRPDWYHVFGKSLPEILAKIKSSKLEEVSAEVLDPKNPHSGVIKTAMSNAFKLKLNKSGVLESDWTSGHLKNLAKSDNVKLTEHLREIVKDLRTDMTVPAKRALIPQELQNYLNSPEGIAIFP